MNPLNPLLEILSNVDDKETLGIYDYYYFLTRRQLYMDLDEHGVDITEWELFSGDLSYPIPDPDGGSPARASRLYPPWDFAYGDLQRRFLNWLIQKLENKDD